MVEKKLTIFKRNIILAFAHFIFNLKKNSKLLLFIILYFQLSLLFLILGIWKLYGQAWHFFILSVYVGTFFILFLRILKYFKYYKKDNVLLWIEKKKL